MRLEEEVFWDIHRQIAEECERIKAYKKENPFLSSGEIEEFERRYQEMRDMNEGAAYLMGVDYEKVIEKLG